MRTLNSYLIHICLLLLLIISISSCKTTKTSKPVSKTYHKAPPKTKPKEEIQKESKSEEKTINEAIDKARSYLGTPYKYGGTTKSGMDCSGLIINTFNSIGIQLPRTSAEQSKLGYQVDLHELQEGDLVFFASKKGQRSIGHVGLVTEVKSKDNVLFIHSTTKLGVCEDNVFSDYYRSTYITARRPKY